MEVRQVRTDEIKLIKIDEPEVNIRYIGRSSSLRGATSDAIWQILRQYKDGDIITSTYALMGEFKGVWDDRTTYFDAATPDPANPLDDITATISGGGIPSAVGQTTMSASMPVVIASDQTALSVSAASLPLPSGASTSALQTTGNTSLSSIDGKLPALGQALAAASVPVVLTAAQITTLTPVSTVTATYAKTAQTASSPTAATVGVASAQAVASNASRKGLILVNTSVNTISLGLGAAAVLNSGITLFPGGSFQMDGDVFTTGAVNAIASAASSNLAIQELT